jgi:hypothetical protein
VHKLLIQLPGLALSRAAAQAFFYHATQGMINEDLACGFARSGILFFLKFVFGL